MKLIGHIDQCMCAQYKNMNLKEHTEHRKGQDNREEGAQDKDPIDDRIELDWWKEKKKIQGIE